MGTAYALLPAAGPSLMLFKAGNEAACSQPIDLGNLKHITYSLIPSITLNTNVCCCMTTRLPGSQIPTQLSSCWMAHKEGPRKSRCFQSGHLINQFVPKYFSTAKCGIKVPTWHQACNTSTETGPKVIVCQAGNAPRSLLPFLPIHLPHPSHTLRLSRADQQHKASLSNPPADTQSQLKHATEHGKVTQARC